METLKAKNAVAKIKETILHHDHHVITSYVRTCHSYNIVVILYVVIIAN